MKYIYIKCNEAKYIQHTKLDRLQRTICNWASPVHSFDCHSCLHSQNS